ncbi:MAG: hypothetical protein JKY46_11670 [Robiginitomaculum sp.]|nr:hypothetical protein [Robiginitomaculum sp.]
MNKTFFIGIIILIIVFSIFSLTQKKGTEKPIEETIKSLAPDINEYSEFREVAQQLQSISQSNAEHAAGTATDLLVINKNIKQDFDRFSKLAVSTATKIDNNNGPQDLACIFRGMSADAIDKLLALESATSLKEQKALWIEAAELFGDVELVLTPRPDLPQWSGETCDIE